MTKNQINKAFARGAFETSVGSNLTIANMSFKQENAKILEADGVEKDDSIGNIPAIIPVSDNKDIITIIMDDGTIVRKQEKDLTKEERETLAKQKAEEFLDSKEQEGQDR